MITSVGDSELQGPSPSSITDTDHSVSVIQLCFIKLVQNKQEVASPVVVLFEVSYDHLFTNSRFQLFVTRTASLCSAVTSEVKLIMART